MLQGTRPCKWTHSGISDLFFSPPLAGRPFVERHQDNSSLRCLSWNKFVKIHSLCESPFKRELFADTFPPLGSRHIQKLAQSILPSSTKAADTLHCHGLQVSLQSKLKSVRAAIYHFNFLNSVTYTYCGL